MRRVQLFFVEALAGTKKAGATAKPEAARPGAQKETKNN